MDWKEYEKITKYIYETLGKEAGVKIDGHGHDCKVKGKSGVEHQIDVLTSHSDGIHTYKTAIECKYWKDTINKDIIMKVAEIIEDAAINKGVIVSKQGFTPDAIEFAKYKNIGLVELREMGEKDWEGRPRILHLRATILRPEVTNILIIHPTFHKVKPERVVPSSMTVKRSNGEEIPLDKYITEFETELRSQLVNKIIEKKIRIPGSKLINNQTNKTVPIEGFIMKGSLTERESGLRFHAINEIWLIMKSIFEGKSFTITKNGDIIEDVKNEN